MTVGEIAEHFPQNRSVISRHLDYMNRFQVVQRRKEGREVYYQANKELIVDAFAETANNMKALMSLQ
ncbi:Transcriptional repressor SdpR [compost metagenome]